MPFKFNLKELLKSTYLKYIGCCLKLRAKPSKKLKLFKEGIEKLQKKFEITNIIRAMQDSDLVSTVVLAKYQKKLIRYFKKNVLHGTDLKDQNPINDHGLLVDEQ